MLKAHALSFHLTKEEEEEAEELSSKEFLGLRRSNQL